MTWRAISARPYSSAGEPSRASKDTGATSSSKLPTPGAIHLMAQARDARDAAIKSSHATDNAPHTSTYNATDTHGTGGNATDTSTDTPADASGGDVKGSASAAEAAAAAAAAEAAAEAAAAEAAAKVGRFKLTVSKPVLKAPMGSALGSALETIYIMINCLEVLLLLSSFAFNFNLLRYT